MQRRVFLTCATLTALGGCARNPFSAIAFNADIMDAPGIPALVNAINDAPRGASVLLMDALHSNLAIRIAAYSSPVMQALYRHGIRRCGIEIERSNQPDADQLRSDRIDRQTFLGRISHNMTFYWASAASERDHFNALANGVINARDQGVSLRFIDRPDIADSLDGFSSPWVASVSRRIRNESAKISIRRHISAQLDFETNLARDQITHDANQEAIKRVLSSLPAHRRKAYSDGINEAQSRLMQLRLDDRERVDFFVPPETTVNRPVGAFIGINHGDEANPKSFYNLLRQRIGPVYRIGIAPKYFGGDEPFVRNALAQMDVVVNAETGVTAHRRSLPLPRLSGTPTPD